MVRYILYAIFGLAVIGGYAYSAAVGFDPRGASSVRQIEPLRPGAVRSSGGGGFWYTGGGGFRYGK